MSTKAKLTLLGSTVFAVTTIWFVHRIQNQEKEIMHQGVIRDEERKKNKQKNILEYKEQKELYAELVKDQNKFTEQTDEEK
ncbi:hypothetical protein BB559_005052 [Furculomyces boomerangus]|uniref:Uncharacterized protein n=2 Tax=Harpellales TaxID=61421 RepID=A0A2T9YB24_9FUNG|nr:hypothetical protein BB559_005052 [Furculomyces boomerangus]PWA00020.1 hypothetical protein BB558_003892 [Smittium angustum]PWA02472.1 hypothetical protein BB558_001364 [Smittium angustum]